MGADGAPVSTPFPDRDGGTGTIPVGPSPLCSGLLPHVSGLPPTETTSCVTPQCPVDGLESSGVLRVLRTEMEFTRLRLCSYTKCIDFSVPFLDDSTSSQVHWAGTNEAERRPDRSKSTSGQEPITLHLLTGEGREWIGSRPLQTPVYPLSKLKSEGRPDLRLGCRFQGPDSEKPILTQCPTGDLVDDTDTSVGPNTVR